MALLAGQPRHVAWLKVSPLSGRASFSPPSTLPCPPPSNSSFNSHMSLNQYNCPSDL